MILGKIFSGIISSLNEQVRSEDKNTNTTEPPSAVYFCEGRLGLL
ncbi:hypothetical protein AusDCA_2571 [Desulfitobacterium sp. AusDCA]